MVNVLDRPINRQSNVQAEKPVGVRFLELRHGQCKFPLGAERDRPEWFCGEPAEGGKPYCGAHRRIAYVKPPRRL